MTAGPEDALDKLLELVVLLNADMRRDFERRGLTAARTHALWVLAELGPSSQRALAQALGVTARNVTGIVDGLVETGFVTREPHPGDRRATLVTFTAKGSETVADLRKGQKVLAGQLFGDMPTGRFAEFVQGMDDVLTVIRRELDAGAP
ncbi:MarR family winged helix-turn-helix transcriptional regulator [Kineosporia succinea]|uniref:DNA-binding MarR family transcriptional regulator n=1 Tax=Kineosporia succinea TaxID=84632 RepID=A0ABT9P723_9ACTN|nr:MarR family transcriptional regulator [Kineosporia succinea]MDP9828473.1 DNA-binding MarR family transcriptional regulator [Kineosporia succinea]